MPCLLNARSRHTSSSPNALKFLKTSLNPSGVTVVIGAEMTRRRLAERAIETIMQTRPKFAAVVLNKVDFARNKYYYSRYYGHQYKNYYADAAV